MVVKRLAFILALIAAVSFVSCGARFDSTDEESRAVMAVDEWEVPYEMYRYFVMMHLRDQAKIILADSGDSSAAESADTSDAADVDPSEEIASAVSGLTEEEKKTLAAEIEDYSIEAVVNIYSLFTAAKEEGIDPFGDMINSLTDMEMEEIRATYKNDQEYLDTIKLYYMNNSVYSVLTRYKIVFDQLYELYVKNGDIDISDNAVIEHMKGDDAVRVKQILISFERHSEEEALSLAEEVYQELLSYISPDGIVDEDGFDSLTDRYGEDLFMFKNRDGYYIPRGYTDSEFEEASFALETGHVSGIVRTSAGYSIIMRADKDPKYIEENVSTLKETCLSGIYRSMLDEFAEKAEVKKYDELSEIDIYSMD